MDWLKKLMRWSESTEELSSGEKLDAIARRMENRCNVAGASEDNELSEPILSMLEVIRTRPRTLKVTVTKETLYMVEGEVLDTVTGECFIFSSTSRRMLLNHDWMTYNEQRALIRAFDNEFGGRKRKLREIREERRNRVGRKRMMEMYVK